MILAGFGSGSRLFVVKACAPEKGTEGTVILHEKPFPGRETHEADRSGL